MCAIRQSRWVVAGLVVLPFYFLGAPQFDPPNNQRGGRNDATFTPRGRDPLMSSPLLKTTMAHKGRVCDELGLIRLTRKKDHTGSSEDTLWMAVVASECAYCDGGGSSLRTTVRVRDLWKLFAGIRNVRALPTRLFSGTT